MNSATIRQQLIKSLQDPEYRRAFIVNSPGVEIAFQIRTMRERRNLTQDALGKLAGKSQNQIARIEDPNYGKMTLATLKALAVAFDTALIVRFAPISELVAWKADDDADKLIAPSFSDDKGLKEFPTAAHEAPGTVTLDEPEIGISPARWRLGFQGFQLGRAVLIRASKRVPLQIGPVNRETLDYAKSEALEKNATAVR